MAIYTRNQEGELTPLKIPAIKGEDGITPNIAIGTVTTLKAGEKATVTKTGTLENPIFNFGIPKGQDGTGVGSGTSIDDTTISKDKTWSSSKIEDFVLTNDDVVWTDVNGENLSIDYTKEGYLREVEIWGNTWQDSDSKNLFNMNNIKTGYYFNSTGNEIAEDASFYGVDYIPIKVGTTYIQNTPVGSICRLCEYDSDKTFIQRIALSPNQTYTPPEGVSYVRLAFYQAGLSHLGQLEVGTVSTSYEPYHKADLSDIQHLGELYVDELGQPILDGLGREQYKIEIESCNKNLAIPLELVSGDGWYERETGWVNVSNGFQFKLPHEIKSGTQVTIKLLLNRYQLGQYVHKVRITTNNGEELNFTQQNYNTVGIHEIHQTFTLNNNMSNFMLSMGTAGTTNFVKFKDIQICIGEGNYLYQPHQSNKTTILLPCQLMKVGDVKDRLFWDSEKGKYVVEKNILEDFVDGTETIGMVTNSATGAEHPYFVIEKKNTNPAIYSLIITTRFKTFKSNGIHDYSDRYGISWTLSPQNTKKLAMRPEEVFLNVDDFRKFLQSNTFYFYYTSMSPQLIETNITEQIKLPTYKDKTHVFVSGNIDGSIKAKTPLNGGQAILSLSQENKELKEVNQELKATNDIQDELINTTMLATDEMYMMIEPLLVQTLNVEKNSKMVDMYAAMMKRGLKKIEDVPTHYRKQIVEKLNIS